jgi:hypothetical protein
MAKQEEIATYKEQAIVKEESTFSTYLFSKQLRMFTNSIRGDAKGL